MALCLSWFLPEDVPFQAGNTLVHFFQNSQNTAELLLIVVVVVIEGLFHALRKVSNVLVMVWIVSHCCAKLLCCPRITEWISSQMISLP